MSTILCSWGRVKSVSVTNAVWQRTAQPSVLEAMQEFLIHHGFSPGDRLPTEATFTVELGVSRYAVREAVRALEALGIVEVKHGQGTFLRGGSLDGLGNALTFWSRLSPSGDPDTLRLIADVRKALEARLISEVVPLHTEESLAELEETVHEMETHALRGTLSPAADRRFHELLYQPLNNWVLNSILHAFWDTLRRVSETSALDGDPPRIAQQHRAILEALRRRNIEEVNQATDEHFRNY